MEVCSGVCWCVEACGGGVSVVPGRAAVINANACSCGEGGAFCRLITSSGKERSREGRGLWG